MPEPLRWGIMGTGNIARQFTAGAVQSLRGQVVAVGSRSGDSAQAFAKEFKLKGKSHPSYDALIADKDFDAIYLSLPNSMHHEWAIKAMRAGKHVLCEKPLSVTLAEAQEMFDVARKTGRMLIEAFMYRAHPQTFKAVELVRSGAIGNVKLVRTSFCYRLRKFAGNIRFDAKLAGGALMDVGCYCLNFSRFMTGQEPSDIQAVAQIHESGVDELTSGVLKFPSGAVAEFTVGMITEADNTAYVCGDEGYLKIPVPWKPPPGGGRVIVSHANPTRQDNPAGVPAPPGDEVHTIADNRALYTVEADAFADAVQDIAPPFVSEADTLGNMKCIEQILRQIGLRS